jgi:hypothetical protein
MHTDDDAHGAGRRMSARALQTIEGEHRAAEFLERLQAQQADPDELAGLVSLLDGATLRGFCAALSKAIGGRHVF